MSPQSWYSVTNRAGIAELSIHDEISSFGVTFSDFAADLKAIKSPVINLSLNSPGGLVDDGVAIYNSLKAHPAEIHVHIPAIAASIATVIAMAGDTITIAPHARMMVHEAMSMGIGFASDFEKVAARLRSTTQTIAEIYTERTGKDVGHWLALMAEETWFGDQEAVDAGLADAVGRDTDASAFKVAASFNLSQFRDSNIAAELRAVAETPEEEPEEAPADPVVEPTEPTEEVQDGDEPVEQNTIPVSHRETRRLAVDAALEVLKV